MVKSNIELPDVVAKLKAGEPIREDLSDVTRLHIDRPQPFLLFHTRSQTPPGLVAERVCVVSGCYLLLRSDPKRDNISGELLRKTIGGMADFFPDVLAIELIEIKPDDKLSADCTDLPALDFQIEVSGDAAAESAAHTIATALQDADLKYRTAQAHVSIFDPSDAPETARACQSDNVRYLRIGFPSVYWQPGQDEIFPELLERMTSALYDAVLQGVHVFATETKLKTRTHHRAYGRSVLDTAVKKIDHQIMEVCSSFDFLMSVTPINSAQCWAAFQKSNFKEIPNFRYRPLAISTDAAKRKLHDINVDMIEDPVLIDIFREKQREVDQQLTMLQLRNTPRFQQAGILVYGDISKAECDQAQAILDKLKTLSDSGPHGSTDPEKMSCEDLKAEACKVAKRYQENYAGFEPEVIVRDDMPAGLLVSAGKLMISAHSAVPKHRVHALLTHEIGVHLVTYFAGAAQPLKIFSSGLAGYEGIQEGLGVFGEYAVGGLTQARMKLIAARVIACRGMLDGADFIQTFHTLADDLGFSEKGAFNIALRVHRSGGLAKDAIYLRGLADVLTILQREGDLDPFWVGKIAPQHARYTEELLDRELLITPPVTPEFLDDPKARPRIERVKAGLPLSELLDAA